MTPRHRPQPQKGLSDQKPVRKAISTYRSHTPGKENSATCVNRNGFKDTPSMKRASIKSGAIRVPAKRPRKDNVTSVNNNQHAVPRPTVTATSKINIKSIVAENESFIKKGAVGNVVREKPLSPFAEPVISDQRIPKSRQSLFYPPIRREPSRNAVPGGIASRDLPRSAFPEDNKTPFPPVSRRATLASPYAHTPGRNPLRAQQQAKQAARDNAAAGFGRFIGELIVKSKRQEAQIQLLQQRLTQHPQPEPHQQPQQPQQPLQHPQPAQHVQQPPFKQNSSFPVQPAHDATPMAPQAVQDETLPPVSDMDISMSVDASLTEGDRTPMPARMAEDVGEAEQEEGEDVAPRTTALTPDFPTPFFDSKDRTPFPTERRRLSWGDITTTISLDASAARELPDFGSSDDTTVFLCSGGSVKGTILDGIDDAGDGGDEGDYTRALPVIKAAARSGEGATLVPSKTSLVLEKMRQEELELEKAIREMGGF